jgi:hypothetical protein
MKETATDTIFIQFTFQGIQFLKMLHMKQVLRIKHQIISFKYNRLLFLLESGDEPLDRWYFEHSVKHKNLEFVNVCLQKWIVWNSHRRPETMQSEFFGYMTRSIPRTIPYAAGNKENIARFNAPKLSPKRTPNSPPTPKPPFTPQSSPGFPDFDQ